MFKKINVRKRLLLGFSLLIFAIIIVNGVILYYMKTLSNLTAKLYKHPYTVSTTAYKIETYIIKMHRTMKDVALAENNSQIDKAATRVAAYEKKVFREFEIISERFLGDKKQVMAIQNLFTAWKPIRNEVINLMKSDNKKEAAQITKGKGLKYVNLLTAKMRGLTDFAEDKASSFYQNAVGSERKAMNLA